MHISLQYLAAGANSIPGASDWYSERNLLAFGAGQNVAICDTPVRKDAQIAVKYLLSGHLGSVTAVKFVPLSPDGNIELVSGSEDATIRIWRQSGRAPNWTQSFLLEGDSGSITCLGIDPQGTKIVAGFTSKHVIVWIRNGPDHWKKLFTYDFQLSIIPLAIATLSGPDPDDFTIFATGTSSTIQILRTDSSTGLSACGVLPGHEGWIRSLDLICVPRKGGGSEYLLASGSQDKTIRLWKIVKQTLLARTEEEIKHVPLQNKQISIARTTGRLLISFETILFGHDDWIYSLKWHEHEGELRLLSSSADSSFIIWSPGQSSTFWEVQTRIGELSIQKGSTTATGSAGGLFAAFWGQSGTRIVSLGQTGSWKSWTYNSRSSRWESLPGISGHTEAVEDVAWSRNGNALYSVSSDQTTRLHAEQIRGNRVTWHEIGRPQIHGYNIVCLTTLPTDEIATAAEEKIVRIFSRPASTARLLNGLRGSNFEHEGSIVNASIPVLGLSNKQLSTSDQVDDLDASNGLEADSVHTDSTASNDVPPTEEILSKSTLWPELEKLYGHGFEISAITSSNSGHLLATACRASAIEHAGIRVFSTGTWNEICPPLLAHSSTIHALTFSHDDRYLLSVGKDRRWTLFCTNQGQFDLLVDNENAHSRMILDAAWLSGSVSHMFVTVGRDRNLKLWQYLEISAAPKHELRQTIAFTQVPTSVDCKIAVDVSYSLCAVGLEKGNIEIFKSDLKGAWLSLLIRVDQCLCPSLSILSLAWRPELTRRENEIQGEAALAVAAADNSLRVIVLKHEGV